MKKQQQQAEARKKRALELHAMGIKGAEIARFLGVGKRAVYDYVKDAPEPEASRLDLESWIECKNSQVLELQTRSEHENQRVDALIVAQDEAAQNARKVQDAGVEAVHKVEEVRRSLNAQIERITAIDNTAASVARNAALHELKQHEAAFSRLNMKIVDWMERMGIPAEEGESQLGLPALIERIDQLESSQKKGVSDLETSKARIYTQEFNLGRLDERVDKCHENLLGLMKEVGGLKQNQSFTLEALEKLTKHLDDAKKLVDDLATRDRQRQARESLAGLPPIPGQAVVFPHYSGLGHGALEYGLKVGEQLSWMFESLFQLDTEEWVALVRCCSDLRDLVRTGLKRMREKKEAEAPTLRPVPVHKPGEKPAEA